MTTDSRQPQEFIITERQINALRLELPPEIINDLMSRPAPASTTAPATRPVDVPITINRATGEFDIDLTEHNAEIRRQAREQDAKKYLEILNSELPDYDCRARLKHLMRESPRSQQQGGGPQ